MPRSNIITGLDIGTGSVKVLVTRETGGNLELISKSEISSFGLRKGVVVNVEETEKVIRSAISEAERVYGKPIKSAFINIQGTHLHVKFSHGLVSVSRADQKISREDIERVLQATQTVNLSSNQEILEVIPQNFIIDSQKEIKEPLGLNGIRLEAKVLLLVCFSPYLKNLTQAVLNSSIKIEDIIPSSIAASRAVLTPQQKELGVVLIDIGAGTTSLAVFEEGTLIHFAVLPVGSANITNDIAIGFRIEIDTAEKIKKQFGACLSVEAKKEKKSRTKNKIEFSDKSSNIEFTQKMLIDIIKPRVSEIFSLIQKELKKISRQELLPGGAVLTGGGAKIPQIVELGKQELKLPCKIGIPRGIKGLDDDPALATVAGLCLEGVEMEIDEPILGGIIPKIKRIFRIFVP